MPTQINYQGDGGTYKTPDPCSPTVDHAQTNFDGGRTTKKGGTNDSSRQKNLPIKASIGVKQPRSYFGEKSGTGQNNGY